jgi:hypothetical protein
MGGSSSGDPTTLSYFKDAHRAIVVGLDDAGNKWADMDTANTLNLQGTFSDNPSAVRYIYETTGKDAKNPFYGVSAYDPSSELIAAQTEIDNFVANVLDIEEDTDVPAWLSLAETAVEGDLETIDVDSLLEGITVAARRHVSSAVADALSVAASSSSDAILEKARAGFEIRARRDHLKDLNVFNAGMAQVGSVQTSAFVIGTAVLIRGMEDRIAQFDADFSGTMTKAAFDSFMLAFRDEAMRVLGNKMQDHLESNRQKATYILQATGMMVDTMRTRLNFEQAGASLKTEYSRVSVVAHGEQYEKDLDYDERYALWDLELFQRGANIFSAVSGSVVPAGVRTNRVSSAIGGALGGAATGAAVTGGNPIGIGVGAALGGIAGILEG